MVIAAQDKAALSQANGVGGKLATRILTELKDSVGDLGLGSAALAGTSAASAQLGSATGDAISALVNLGYRRGEAARAVASAARALSADAALEDLIRASLGELAK